MLAINLPMNGPVTYIPSQTLPGDAELLREHGFTRWMSRDLLQAASDFCKNLGLIAIYSECSPGPVTRYLFWRPPQGTMFEVRSGRAFDQFKAYDKANAERGWPLLSLHINENRIYSGVWISPDHYETGKAVLTRYGITPAERQAAGPA
jgi:hypothetical protein